jgi:hypothetical protein
MRRQRCHQKTQALKLLRRMSTASAGCSGKLQGSLQMIVDLRQCLAPELLEVHRVGSILDLPSEQRRISLLIFDLTVHIVPVQGCGRPDLCGL